MRTCQGQLFGTDSIPPIILVEYSIGFIADTPHSYNFNLF